MSEPKMPPLAEFDDISQRSQWIADWLLRTRRPSCFVALLRAVRGCFRMLILARARRMSWGESLAVATSPRTFTVLFGIHRGKPLPK